MVKSTVDPCPIGADVIDFSQPSLLIAHPTIPDQRFHQTVILTLNHDDSGTLGLCLNRQTNTQVSDLVLDTGSIAELEFPVYWGGPVNPRTLWMLHSTEWFIEGSVELSDSWAMTSSLAMFEEIVSGNLPREMRIFAGFCHWGPGQLAEELIDPQGWLWAPASGPELLFNQPDDHLWAASTELSKHLAVNSWL